MMNSFSTYNARYLEPEQVAEKFILSESFLTLVKNHHSIILGARGCGKTAAMKMLTLPALYNWKNVGAKKIRESIPFYAIYISTDIYWDAKNKSYEKQLEDFGDFFDKISRFSVNSNVFIATCNTFLNILKFEISDANPLAEIELSTVLIDRWRLKDVAPQLVLVREALLKRIDDVNQQIRYCIYNDIQTIPDEDFFYLDFDSSLSYIFDAFKRIYPQLTDKKWALCFDELEFAPKWLQESLYKSLRSRNDQRVLYKISSSPILPKELESIFMGNYSASAGNDFDCIKMWATGNEENFAIEIIESILRDNKISEKAKSYFGKNNLYLDDKVESYGDGSEYIEEIKSLANIDESFVKYLKYNEINPLVPTPKSNRQKASIFRKIKPIVYFRNQFIKENQLKSGLELRTRKKNVDLYNGIEILSKICEGNPRWLIGLTNSIIEKSGENNRALQRVQYDEIINTSNRFINSIENIAIELKDNNISIRQFINRIGLYFNEELLGEEFKPEPGSTFRVDVNNPDYLTILEKGLFQGAFILVENEQDSFDFDVLGKRLKLSYLYYPKFRLPIRKSKEISLRKILTNGQYNNTVNLFNLDE
ncbi:MULTISPECIES: ORC-CDC6 family AAA ATPase [unclassified Chryseobacterium]|uniref:ORC-CDC6 family AAA ATPase n=1 Tax=unclassified Chryseobacterium TaxID=2593645 RepID=UPI0028534C83|nr:hypothetical protein [Chryseobacterium sp. CFS7]MDR4892716.1 hypothetical protein [Chryseobacterium sp. CFS7]